jgi:signal transduction histidine kinase
MEVMENLIGNAIKFTPAKGTVKISFKRNAGEIQVRISDTGPGIAPEDLSLLFKKFSRLVKPESKMPLAPGTGLGLYIAQQIITLHQGRIWVESKLGEGSTFIFSLPEAK